LPSGACAALRAVDAHGASLRIATCAGRLRCSPGARPAGLRMRGRGLRFAQIDAHDTSAVANDVACHDSERDKRGLMSIDSA